MKQLNNKEILLVLQEAKQEYLEDFEATNGTAFICTSITSSLLRLYDINIELKEVSLYIPEVNPVFCGAFYTNSTIWWNRRDYESRLEAFDKLISHCYNKVYN